MEGALLQLMLILPHASYSLYTFHIQDSTARRMHGGKVSQLVIHEVFEGGSTKKGTTVPGEPFDVDLIIYCTSTYVNCIIKKWKSDWL